MAENNDEIQVRSQPDVKVVAEADVEAVGTAPIFNEQTNYLPKSKIITVSDRIKSAPVAPSLAGLTKTGLPGVRKHRFCGALGSNKSGSKFVHNRQCA